MRTMIIKFDYFRNAVGDSRAARTNLIQAETVNERLRKSNGRPVKVILTCH